MIDPDNINKRIGRLIKKLGLTKTAFAKSVNVSQAYISKIVKAGSPSDMFISNICSKHNVNENWLRTGAGGEENMFIPADMIYIQNVGNLGAEKNEFKKFYLNLMMGLPDEYWNYIYDEFMKFSKIKKDS